MRIRKIRFEDESTQLKLNI